MRRFHLERLVASTVFWGSFESGLLPPSVSPTVILIWLVAFLATPGYLLAFAVGVNLGGSNPATLLDRLLAPTLLLIVLSMAAMVLVALLVWESVYPDRRDVRILGAIGLKSRTLVLGRIGAVAAVAVVVAVGMNLPSSIVFGLVLLTYDAASNPVQAILGHFTATVCGGLFAFFLVMTLQGGLLSLFGATTARRAALVMQAVIVVGLVQAVQHVPTAADEMRLAFSGGSSLTTTAFPPTWFLAFQSIVVGRPSPPPLHYAAWAVGATAFVVLLSLLFLAAAHTRITRMALEAPGPRRTKAPLGRRFLNGAVGHGLGPVQRGVAAFTLWTLTRSRPHLLVLAVSVGLTIALVSAALVVAFGPGGETSSLPPSPVLLSAPLTITFILLCCGRMLLAVPLESRANWVFRIVADNRNTPELVGGARVALIVLAVAPAAAIAAATLWEWGPSAAAGHAAFTVVMGILLTDVLLFRYRSIPFTSAYRPAGARIGSLWPLYLMAFSLYCYSLARLEVWLISRPVAWGLFMGTALGASSLLAHLRRSDLAPPRQLEYDAPDPDELFQGFGLGEGLAARRGTSGAYQTKTLG